MELELARAAGGDAFAGGGDTGIIGGSQSPPVPYSTPPAETADGRATAAADAGALARCAGDASTPAATWSRAHLPMYGWDEICDSAPLAPSRPPRAPAPKKPCRESDRSVRMPLTQWWSERHVSARNESTRSGVPSASGTRRSSNS